MFMKEEIHPRCSSITYYYRTGSDTIARKRSRLKICAGPVLVHSVIGCFVTDSDIHEHVLWTGEQVALFV